MERRGRDGEQGLLNLVLYALAAYGDPPLTQVSLLQAVIAAFGSPEGRRLADAAGLPSPELMASQGEVVGAFGDWLRARGLVEGCGFSRAGDVLTCTFRACACLAAVDRLRAERPDVAPPCVVVGLLAALLQAKGIHAKVLSFRRADGGCEWQLELGR